MPTPRYKRSALLICLLPLLVLLVPVVLTWRVWKQARLDNALIAHIKANDADAVIADLKQGADANAVETVGAVPSFGQMLRTFFQHRSSKPGRVNTALGVTFETTQSELYPGMLAYTEPPAIRNIRLLQALLGYGANPNILTIDGVTPLYRAIHYDNAEAIKALLSKGANVNQGVAGITPLMRACIGNDFEVVPLLLQAGAHPNATDDYKRTPLHFAAGQDSPALLKILLDAHADINARDEKGQTPLFLAIVQDNGENVRWLLEQNADPNLMDERGYSPLIKAIMNGRDISIIRLLLAHHADPNETQTKGWTPLQVAYGYKHKAIAKILRQAGAKK